MIMSITAMYIMIQSIAAACNYGVSRLEFDSCTDPLVISTYYYTLGTCLMVYNDLW